MKYLYALLLIVISISGLLAQQPIKIYNIKAVKDSFQVKESTYTYPKEAIIANDTSAYGTNLYSNVVTIKTDIDSVKIVFNPKYEPDEQRTQVNIITPRHHEVVFYNFHEMRNKFSKTYMDKAKGAAQYEIPETYELANVLYALTKSSDDNSNRTLKNTAYFKQVNEYFSRYKDHPLLQQLQFDVSKDGTQNYYSFRENSFCYKFDDEKIVRNKQYNIVYGETKDNTFQKLLPLITDFAKKSHFRTFYKEHKTYYDSLIVEEEKFMPIKKMRIWLENNFKSRIQSYKVVFSPLILGSHSTQQFSWIEDVRTGFFIECVMFVSGMEVFPVKSGLTDVQKEGLASGIVFTEIDHNYCNPVSENYTKKINEALSNRELWIAKNGDGNIYENPVSIFNEYITHAVYVLYCFDSFKNQGDFNLIKQSRETLMTDRRKYLQFKAFDDTLLNLYKNKASGQTIRDLYPAIIEWCKAHN